MLQALALCILWEMSRGPNSVWGPYLRTLPYIHSLARWSAAALEELQDP